MDGGFTGDLSAPPILAPTVDQKDMEMIVDTKDAVPESRGTKVSDLSDVVFIEFFVPGESRTVWVPGADACAWNPTGLDIRGRHPVREVRGHVHGEGDV